MLALGGSSIASTQLPELLPSCSVLSNFQIFPFLPNGLRIVDSNDRLISQTAPHAASGDDG